jgi:hypothetical protein
VGSTPIAQYIYARGCANGKRVQCFGGAKNHMIVMPDADMDQAADALIGAGYGAAGERCMAISVAVPVGDATADALIEKLVPRIEKLKVGPYTAGNDVDYGPLVTGAAMERVKGLIGSGVEQGAELVMDGRDFRLQGYEKGFFVGPTLFDRATKRHGHLPQEIFGPVLTTVRAKTYEEALSLAMDHEYGNGTAIFTRDGDTARDFANRINIGMVGINVPIPVPLAYHTFGGWKKSGFGDLNQHGPDAFRFYTRTKTVTARWPSGIKEGGPRRRRPAHRPHGAVRLFPAASPRALGLLALLAGRGHGARLLPDHGLRQPAPHRAFRRGSQLGGIRPLGAGADRPRDHRGRHEDLVGPAPLGALPHARSRICDVSPRLEHTLSLAALTQGRCGCSGGSGAATSAGASTTASSWARTAGARSATGPPRGSSTSARAPSCPSELVEEWIGAGRGGCGRPEVDRGGAARPGHRPGRHERRPAARR